MDLGDPPDAEQRARFHAEFAAGRFGAAMGAYQLGLLRRGLQLIISDNYVIQWGELPTSTFELTATLAMGLDRSINDEGDDASYKLSVARDVIGAIANMQGLLERRFDQTEREASEVLAELLLSAVRLGNAEMILGQTEDGFIEEYATLKWNEDDVRRQRQKGAMATKEKIAARLEQALKRAQEITKANPALSNDDLAYAMKKRDGLDQSIRTITGWIRVWRKDGSLPLLKR